MCSRWIGTKIPTSTRMRVWWTDRIHNLIEFLAQITWSLSVNMLVMYWFGLIAVCMYFHYCRKLRCTIQLSFNSPLRTLASNPIRCIYLSSWQIYADYWGFKIRSIVVYSSILIWPSEQHFPVRSGDVREHTFEQILNALSPCRGGVWKNNNFNKNNS